MKIVSRFVYMLALASLSLGWKVATAQETQTVSVKFPFAVTVGSRTLPAGSYTISSFDANSDAPIFLVRGTGGSAISFVTSRVIAAPHTLTKDDVVVEVTGEKHVLSQVRLQDSGSIFELARPAK